MKFFLNLIVFSMLSLSSIANAATLTSSNPELQKTYEDIQKTLGLVPGFLKAYPEAGLPGAWQEMKSIQLSSSTVLPARVKELIGLAVSSQIPCHYCVYFHTEAAKLNGATENEIKEAISMAATTRHWSTYMSGLLFNEADFQKETDKVMSFMKEQMSKPLKQASATEPSASEASMQTINVIDSQTAYQDIERSFGSVPNYLRMFPEDGIASAWKTMKATELNPETELSAKVKELIALSVTAQIPCRQCIYYHTEAAKVNGSSTVEIHEALAMASVTRFWSTVLNGSQINDKTFRKEVGQIIKHVKSQSAKKVGATAITKKDK